MPLLKESIRNAECHSDSHQRDCIRDVIISMKSDLAYPWTVDELSEISNSSVYHFIRVFKNKTGIPPAHFLCALRIEAAKAALLLTDNTITDICYSIGYNSLGTFSSRFTLLVGISPKQFRTEFAKFTPESRAEILKRRTESLKKTTDSGLEEVLLKGVVNNQPRNDFITVIGFFPNSVPECAPTHCAMTHEDGSFSLVAEQSISNGAICCLGLDLSKSLMDMFLYKHCLRARMTNININQLSTEGSMIKFNLEELVITDPPILTVLPLLLF